MCFLTRVVPPINLRLFSDSVGWAAKGNVDPLYFL